MSSRVNVVHGRFAATSLAMAIRPEPDDVLVHDDVLSCGPLQPCATLDGWRSARGAYWDTVASEDPAPHDETGHDLLASMSRLRAADAIVLWLGTGVADQLLLAWIVRLLDLAGAGSADRLAVVQLTRVGDREQQAWSVGLLNPEQIAAHPPPELLSPDALFDLARCWAAVTADEPAPLLAFLDESSPHVPYLRPSLRRMIDRYPDPCSGLGRWDAELLKFASTVGPSAARVIGHTLVEDMDADLVGDAYLMSRLRRLADPALPHPLVTLRGDGTTIRGCEVTPTEAGSAVLAGRANAVQLNGIEDWVLGVHLDSTAGAVWYRDDGGLQRERDPR